MEKKDEKDEKDDAWLLGLDLSDLSVYRSVLCMFCASMSYAFS